MTSPAVCLHFGSSEWSVRRCSFYFFHKKKCSSNDISLIPSLPYAKEDFLNDDIRFVALAKWVTSKITSYIESFSDASVGSFPENCRIGIEGYSMGSRGKVFNIAENTGILKHVLMNHGLPYIIFPPTTIKKFATGKGNASKEEMENAWIEETSIDLRKILQQTAKQMNPSSDIIDSYYLCKFMFQQPYGRG